MGNPFPKKVLAFHYAWYGTPWGTGPIHEWRGWSSAGYNPEKVINGRRESATPCQPLDGLYDSSSEYTIRRQIYEAKQALIDGFIVSWWGFSDVGANATISKFLEVAPEDFEITLYYETVGFATGEVKEAVKGEDIINKVADDFNRIIENYGKRDRWLKVNNKPVIFVYSRAIGEFWKVFGNVNDAIKAINAVKSKLSHEVFIVGDFGLDPQSAYILADIFDGLHTYNPIGFTTRGIKYSSIYETVSNELHKKGKLWAATVVPGHDNYLVSGTNRLIEPRRDGGYYLDSWDIALSSNPDWVLITSWNEWYENTQIEPSDCYGTTYLYLTRQQVRRFKGL